MSANQFIGRPAPVSGFGRSADLVAAAVMVVVSVFLFGGVAAMVSDFGVAYALAAPSAQNIAAECSATVVRRSALPQVNTPV